MEPTSIKTCEKYFVGLNKWVGLPLLNVARRWPGSVVLESKRVFCFCGTQGGKEHLNSIERIEMGGGGGEWKLLPLNGEVAHSFQLSVVPYFNDILVFGGHSQASYIMQAFTSEGDLKQDLSVDPLIPGNMSQGAFVAQEGRIYAVGWRELKSKWDWRIGAFDGKKWIMP